MDTDALDSDHDHILEGRLIMRISIFSVGSRGDVQPASLLARELLDRGHDVVLGTPDDLVGLPGSLGVPTRPLGFSARALLDSEEGAKWLAAGDMRAFARGVMRFKTERRAGFVEALTEAAEGSDLIVSGVNTMEEASGLAQVGRIPLAGLYYAPRRANPYFPAYPVTTRDLGRTLNRLTYRLVDRSEWRISARYVNLFRAELGLRPVSTSLTSRLRRIPPLEVQAYSSVLVPQLADWSERRPLTGFITPTPVQRRLWGESGHDAELLDWLGSGAPTVYFGFGSMPVKDPQRVIELVSRVAARLGVRALIAAGWSQYAAADERAGRAGTDRVRVVGEVDHGAVLPLCVAAVHHGGAGTTAASVSAGLPTVVASMNFDQPFWGRRLEELGIGALLPYAELTERSLAAALAPLLRPAVVERARAVGRALSAESGVGRAADVLERYASEAAESRRLGL